MNFLSRCSQRINRSVAWTGSVQAKHALTTVGLLGLGFNVRCCFLFFLIHEDSFIRKSWTSTTRGYAYSCYILFVLFCSPPPSLFLHHWNKPPTKSKVNTKLRWRLLSRAVANLAKSSFETPRRSLGQTHNCAKSNIAFVELEVRVKWSLALWPNLSTLSRSFCVNRVWKWLLFSWTNTAIWLIMWKRVRWAWRL